MRKMQITLIVTITVMLCNMSFANHDRVGLSGEWRSGINTGIMLDQDELGQYLDISVDSTGFFAKGTLRRHDFATYIGDVSQTNLTKGCTVRYFNVQYTILSPNQIRIRGRQSDGGCGESTTPQIDYVLERSN